MCIVAVNASATTTKTTPPNKPISTSTIPRQPIDAVPTPSEAPHLLENSGNERKPFVTVKQMKAFTASLVVGAASMGAVYSLLSKQMCDRHADESLLVGRIARSSLSSEELNHKAHQDATEVRKKFVGQFVAPSSFAELTAKANDYSSQKLKPQQCEKGSAMLHDEVSFRAKTFWNECITNVQVALDQFEAQYRERRRANAVEALQARLKEEFPNRSLTLIKV